MTILTNDLDSVAIVIAEGLANVAYVLQEISDGIYIQNRMADGDDYAGARIKLMIDKERLAEEHARE